MMKNKNIKKQGLWWKYAAWTAPFVGLAALISIQLFGLSEWNDIVICIVMSLFIATSVFWWWWALDTILENNDKITKVAEGFEDVKKDLRQFKKDLTRPMD